MIKPWHISVAEREQQMQEMMISYGMPRSYFDDAKVVYKDGDFILMDKQPKQKPSDRLKPSKERG